jgi:hypothetical protein
MIVKKGAVRWYDYPRPTPIILNHSIKQTSALMDQFPPNSFYSQEYKQYLGMSKQLATFVLAVAQLSAINCMKNKREEKYP